MKYFPLIWAALWRRKTRTIFTFLSVAVAFILFGILSGVSGSFAHALGSARLDRLVVDPRFGTPFPKAYADQVAQVPGVAVIAPRTALYAYYKTRGNNIAVVGSDARFYAVRPEVLITKRQIEAVTSLRTGAIIGTGLARHYNIKVGDKLPLIAPNVATKDGGKIWVFDIVGVVDNSENPNGSNVIIANYRYLDERKLGGEGTVDRILVRIDDPAKAAEVSARIDALFANSPAPTRTSSEKANAQSDQQAFGDMGFFTHAVIGAVLFMLLFLTGNSMMQSVRERIPEFAILKTIGFSDGGVLALVLAEAVLLCTLAGATGLMLVKLILPLVADNSRNPLLSILIMPWPAVAEGMAFALATALFSALPPALRVKRLNVVDALRH